MGHVILRSLVLREHGLEIEGRLRLYSGLHVQHMCMISDSPLYKSHFLLIMGAQFLYIYWMLLTKACVIRVNFENLQTSLISWFSIDIYNFSWFYCYVTALFTWCSCYRFFIILLTREIKYPKKLPRETYVLKFLSCKKLKYWMLKLVSYKKFWCKPHCSIRNSVYLQFNITLETL